MSQVKTKNCKNRISFGTRNPCNQFLVQYLIKARQKQANIKMMKGKSRHDHQFHVYTKAIDSVRKYPLPIICEEQLSLLAGIGDCLTSKLVLAIKQHYKSFLKNDKPLQKQQIKEKVANQKIQEKVLNWIPSDCSSSKSMSVKSADDADQQQFDSQNRDKILPYPFNFNFKSQIDYNSEKTKSQSLSRKAPYKPRQGSQASYIIKALKLLNATAKSCTKKDIDKCLLQNNYDKIKQWKNAKQTLLSNGYIELDLSVDYQSFFMTAKGQSFAVENQQSQNSNLTKKKMASQISSFRQKIVQKQKQEAQFSMTQAISQNSQTNSKSYSTNTMNELIIRKRVERKQAQNIIIIIDTREMKDQSQRTYFQETLVEKYKIDVITHALTIGDFAFSYNGQILDYIIERKKADDLAASIIDGRYKQQKYRLKNSGAKNIIYLYEGHPSQSSLLKQKELMSALIKTRVTDGFTVHKTARVNQTVKLLAQLHNQLQNKINMESQQISTIGTIEQFNYRNAKNRYLTVQSVFGLGLKSFPNVGKQTVTNILRYFKSYYILYKELQKYENNNERVQFLNGLLKGGRTQANVTTQLVQFLFNKNYLVNKSEQIVSKSNISQNNQNK